MRVIAKTMIDIGRRRFRCGDQFDVTPALADALVRMGRVELVRADVTAADDERPRRRKYQRRDLRAED